MVNQSSWNIPEVPNVRPNGRCYCGCDGTPKPGKYFVITHDRKGEARVIRERYGSIANFVLWSEAHLPRIEN
jgi:hypothetical protein